MTPISTGKIVSVKFYDISKTFAKMSLVFGENAKTVMRGRNEG